MATQVEQLLNQIAGTGWEGAVDAPELSAIGEFLSSERAPVYPSFENIFKALALTPLKEVRAVIMGDEPYANGSANGLAYGVLSGRPLPLPLKTIFKEIGLSLGLWMPSYGTLEGWAKQGILLLNSVLTVADGRPGSHANIGWNKVTDNILRAVAERERPIIFMLWGDLQQRKGGFIQRDYPYKHLILKAKHPSSQLFLGCNHFYDANQAILRLGEEPFDWDKV